jgi:hypothetical protein
MHFVFGLLSYFLFMSNLYAHSYRPNQECVFAILTYKTGLASALSHNHFIIHKLPHLKIELDSSSWGSAVFKAEFKVEDLIVDDFEQVKKWTPKLL